MGAFIYLKYSVLVLLVIIPLLASSTCVADDSIPIPSDSAPPTIIESSGLDSNYLRASFTVDPLSGPVPLKVNYTDTSTGNPTSWFWYFNDGTYSHRQNVSKTYTQTGTYAVMFKVKKGQTTDITGEETRITVTDPPVPIPTYPIIDPNPLTPPGDPNRLKASFIAYPLSGPVPLRVTFTDTSTGYPTSWFWYFNDGTQSFSQNVSKTFTEPGTYSIMLKVKNNDATDITVRENLITVTV